MITILVFLACSSMIGLALDVVYMRVTGNESCLFKKPYQLRERRKYLAKEAKFAHKQYSSMKSYRPSGAVNNDYIQMKAHYDGLTEELKRIESYDN